MSISSMRLLRLIIVAAGLLLLQATTLALTAAQSEVVILCSHHMDSPGRDQVNVDVDGVTKPRHQREVTGQFALLRFDHRALTLLARGKKCEIENSRFKFVIAFKKNRWKALFKLG